MRGRAKKTGPVKKEWQVGRDNDSRSRRPRTASAAGDHIVLGISARSHVDAATLRRALERMDAAWPEGEEHMAKLSVNAMIGLWARSTEVVYSVRSSLRLRGGHGGTSSTRLLTQRLPKRFAERLRALEALRHPDGTPVYRVEETKPLLGSRAPRMEAERPKQRRWNGVDDAVGHCLAGNSLLLTGLPGTGKTHLARTIVARLRGRGGAPGVQDALLRAEAGAGGADGRPLGAQVRARGQRAKAGLAGGGDHLSL